MRIRHLTSAIVLAIASATIRGGAAPGQAAEAVVTEAPAIRLVLLVAIDQLRRDRLDATSPGGLGRLAREGRVFTDAVVDHAISATCPGHASMLTGRHPGPAGIPANRTLDRETGQPQYCVADASEDATVLGGSVRRSPRNLTASTLGDWLREARPGSRSFAVSAKDRAALTLSGRGGDGAWWFLRDGTVGFTTSRYYLDALPDWVQRWRGEDPASDGFLRDVPSVWEHPKRIEESPRLDDYRPESDRFRRTSGHPVRAQSLATFAERLYYSPFMDDVTLDFARALVVQEGVGVGQGTDLLAVSLSATDLIGHNYGPESVEADDALRRLDAALGVFLEFLEARVGAERMLVVLTADHGVLPIPRWLVDTGRAECPNGGGRVPKAGLKARVNRAISTDLGEEPLADEPWFYLSGSQVVVNRKAAARRDIPADRLMAAVERALEADRVVAQAWTAAEMATGESEMARLYRNSHHPTRSGDLTVQVESGCLISVYEAGTSHGSPYDYDRAVPLVFRGAGIEPGRVAGRAATVDIAPTLARLLGLQVPDGLDGRPLFGP